MAYVKLEFRDNRYTLRLLEPEELWTIAAQQEASGTRDVPEGVRYVSDGVLAAWGAHCAQDEVFQALWRAYDSATRTQQDG